MKKTLIAVAALSAMACSAMAAQVTLSGVVDLGLNYTHVKTGDVKTNSFKMMSGQNSGSRFMLKGSEELGNDVEVGFQLENGFNADDGSLSSTNRIFHRESRLYVKTAFGTIHAGRFGGLDAGTGSVSIFGGSDLCAFGTGWGDSIMKESAVLKGISARYDNSIAYQSPTLAGFTLYLDYSFKNDTSIAGTKDEPSTEGRPSADRYGAVGLKYVNGAFNAAFVYSRQNYGKYAGYSDTESGNAYSLGAGYDFGVCKLMAEGQYFDMGKSVSKKTESVAGVATTTYSLKANQKGWGGILSVTAPIAAGKVYASVGYKDAEDVSDSSTDYKLWNVGVAYSYSFSKRTTFYAAAGYTEDKTEKSSGTTKTKTTEVAMGLVHKF